MPAGALPALDCTGIGCTLPTGATGDEYELPEPVSVEVERKSCAAAGAANSSIATNMFQK